MMHVKPIHKRGSNLIEDYRSEQESIMQYFSYNPFHEDAYQMRLQELNDRHFKREELARVLTVCNEKWGAGKKSIENINRLLDKESVAVVGGQQAGLLTGPLYTIHKMISILMLAKEQEEKLGIPVVPIFWIAGEDHDFPEINHIELPEPPYMKKYKIVEKHFKKEPVSSKAFNKEEAMKWLENIFVNLEETNWTKELYNQMQRCVAESNSYVDFFAKVTFTLFPNEGLVLLDSNDPNIRQLESDYFVQMIKNRQEIAFSVRELLKHTSKEGYSVALDAETDDGHLFYHLDGERILLTINEQGEWAGKNGECSFTEEELVAIAKEKPYLLSNNVVTRPIMQDLLLPVLAFIGGPGEIAYWSVLKKGFEALDIQMPPVVPRLSFTLVDHVASKRLAKLGLKLEDVLENGTLEEKGFWLKRQMNPPIEELADHLRFAIEKAHKPLKEAAQEMQADLGRLADKNLMLLFREVDYLEQRLQYELSQKHERVLQQFDWLEAFLHPSGGLQERSWNVIYFLNEYGDQWLSELLAQDYDWKTPHFAVFL